MELTPEKVRELLNLLLLEAKRQRGNIPYSNTDGFPQAIFAPYDEGPNDTIHWLAPPKETGTHHFNLLPDWWV